MDSQTLYSISSEFNKNNKLLPSLFQLSTQKVIIMQNISTISCTFSDTSEMGLAHQQNFTD